MIKRIWTAAITISINALVRLSPKSQIADMRRLATVGWHKLHWILNNSPTGMKFTDLEREVAIRNFRSQLGQDVLALSVKGASRPGFFVEFGATNGLDLSNTYLLEKEFGWTGLVSEPAKRWHKDLKANRSCAIDHRCVYSSSGDNISFTEAKVGELSTIDGFGSDDEHESSRKDFTSYKVETISLNDLLKSHEAPSHIDFISIDTEGSEFEILNAFNFAEYSFGLICVEHNFTAQREKIFKLLSAHGYHRIYESLSDFDDWYVQATN